MENQMGIPYTRLPKEMLDQAIAHQTSNASRAYHNWSHVERLYVWAEELGFEYDYALDLAIAHHDFIYDSQPDKELRSANYILEVVQPMFDVDMCTSQKAHDLIMTTVDHTPCKDNRLIVLDLADLSVDFFREFNAKNLKIEAFKMYGIDNYTYISNSLKFLRGLRNRLEDNQNNWHPYSTLFADVCMGISKDILRLQTDYANL